MPTALSPSLSVPILRPPESNRELLRQLLALALPVLAENICHMIVGINDTYLANKLPTNAAAAGAAVGTITYFIWFFGLLVAAVATGATAIIARAKGAKHKSLANSVTGQSMTATLLLGIAVGLGTFVLARQFIAASGLPALARSLAVPYLQLLSVILPFYLPMLVGSACLRGNGNTLAPAIVLIVVDVVNLYFSFALCRGWWPFPVMGFMGIALGTIIAYVVGGVLLIMLLLRGDAGLKLHLHRMRPHVATLKRLTAVGLPVGVESLLTWFAAFGVMFVVNRLDTTSITGNAHMNAIRLESISFMTGLAFAAATSTMVGQSMGMKDPRRATRSTWIAYAVGGGIMTTAGLLMICFGRYAAEWLSPADPAITALTTKCLFITGFIQSGFAAALVFGGALRGAGDTFTVMCVSLATVLGLRLLGVFIIGHWLHKGLAAVWCVLAGELFLRGFLTFLRFLQGGWRETKV